MHLPEDGPHLEARGLVRRNTIRVEAKDEIPGVIMKKPTGAEQVLVSLPILNVLHYAFGGCSGSSCTQAPLAGI